MKTCLKCYAQFPNRLQVNGKIYHLQRRKFCLNCSPFKSHNTRDLSSYSPSIDLKKCPRCKTTKNASEFYQRRNRKGLSSYCKYCTYKQSYERHVRIKQMCVDYKGGKCIYCGYKKCLAALDFHHIDRSNKDHSIGINRSKSFEELKPELDKCVLVCCRCHREIENGITKRPQEDLNL